MTGPRLVRLGNPAGDGGYVVPQWVVESTDVLLTLGIGHDWGFEEDLLRRRPGASIVGVDHTIRAASIRWSLHQALVLRHRPSSTTTTAHDRRIKEEMGDGSS